MRQWVWLPGGIALLLYSAFMLKNEYSFVNTFYVAPEFFAHASTMVVALYFCVIPLIQKSKATVLIGVVLAVLSIGMAGASVLDLWRQQQMSGESIFHQPIDSLFPPAMAGILSVILILRFVYVDSKQWDKG